MTKYIDFALVGELVVHGDVHYEDLKRLPAADVVEVVLCRDCKYAHMTTDDKCKYCDIWFPDEKEYLDGDYYCASGKKKEVKKYK